MDHEKKSEVLNVPQAAICLIECCLDEEVQDKAEAFLVIERATDPRDYWSGHLSFPGGKIEKGETPLEAALRECKEEVGLEITEDHLIDDTIEVGFAGKPGVFGLWVKPYVFRVKEKVYLKPDVKEVAQTLWLPKSHFLENKNHCFGEIPGAPIGESFPYYPMDQKVLWGYSYRVLCEYLKIEKYKNYGPK